jgi:hypothetical protein
MQSYRKPSLIPVPVNVPNSNSTTSVLSTGVLDAKKESDE